MTTRRFTKSLQSKGRSANERLQQNGCSASVRDKASVALLIGCGLRKAEVTSLKVEDINWKESAFNVIGKGNKQAKCFMPAQTILAVQYWLSVRGEHNGYVFSRILKNGTILDTPITGQGITYILEKRAQRRKLMSLRHMTHAVPLLRGCLKVVQMH